MVKKNNRDVKSTTSNNKINCSNVYKHFSSKCERQNEWINIRESLVGTYVGLVRVFVCVKDVDDVVNAFVYR